MSDYRRFDVPGAYYFFTVVSEQRRPIFHGDMPHRCLREAIERTRKKRPFEITAIVLLPDHLHTIWKLPDGDAHYPRRWSLIKSRFTTEFLRAGGTETNRSRSKLAKRER